MELEDVNFARGGAPDAGSASKKKEAKAEDSKAVPKRRPQRMYNKVVQRYTTFIQSFFQQSNGRSKHVKPFVENRHHIEALPSLPLGQHDQFILPDLNQYIFK